MVSIWGRISMLIGWHPLVRRVYSFGPLQRADLHDGVHEEVHPHRAAGEWAGAESANESSGGAGSPAQLTNSRRSGEAEADAGGYRVHLRVLLRDSQLRHEQDGPGEGEWAGFG